MDKENMKRDYMNMDARIFNKYGDHFFDKRFPDPYLMMIFTQSLLWRHET